MKLFVFAKNIVNFCESCADKPIGIRNDSQKKFFNDKVRKKVPITRGKLIN